jgi:carboxylesterase
MSAWMSEAAAAMPAGRRRSSSLDRRHDGVFLIHGLGGTQYDLGSMQSVSRRGSVTHSLTLFGHGTQAEDLANVTAVTDDAVVAKYREVRDLHPRLHLMGMCMGALARPSAQREARATSFPLAPPVYIDGQHAGYRVLRPPLTGPRNPHDEDRGRGTNEQLRAIVKAKFERGENFHYRWVPLNAFGRSTARVAW